MASYTPNYNLKKPADADSYDIADANGNMDIIDGALNTLNGKITTLETQAVRNLAHFNNTTKANITTSLRNAYGGNFVVFATLFDMTDGTATGYYIIWREGDMSGTTQFFKLS